MPKYHLSTIPDYNRGLIDDLAKEWQDELIEGERPDIYLDQPEGQFQPIHVYVAWDQWHELDSQTRSEIIMQAYQQVNAAEAVRVTLALGLTKAEAAKKGFGPR